MKRIPKDFYVPNEEGTLSNCKICDRNLLDGETTFALEKAIKVFPEIQASETIFEISICHKCAMSSRKSLSKQSLNDIENFMTSDQVRKNMMLCMEEAHENNGDTLRYCIITGMKKESLSEFQIIAQCKGQFLLPGTEAFLISSAGIEIIQDLLSPETKEELDRFKNEYFGVPPEFENLLNPTELVFL